MRYLKTYEFNTIYDNFTISDIMISNSNVAYIDGHIELYLPIKNEYADYYWIKFKGGDFSFDVEFPKDVIKKLEKSINKKIKEYLLDKDIKKYNL